MFVVSKTFAGLAMLLSLAACSGGGGTTVTVNGQRVGTDLARPPDEETGDETATDTIATASRTSDATMTEVSGEADGTATDSSSDTGIGTSTVTDVATGTSTDATSTSTATGSSSDTGTAVATDTSMDATSTSTAIETEPQDGSVAVNDGATHTNDAVVSLTLGATGADEMIVSFDADCETGGVWEPFATSKQVSLPDENALNTVYVRYRNDYGESDCVSDVILHDDVAPAAAVFVSTTPASPSSIAEDVAVRVSVASSDAIGVKFYLDSLCATTPLIAPVLSGFADASIDFPQNVDTTVYARVFDSAANMSSCASLTLYEHDNAGPSVLSVSANTADGTYREGTTIEIEVELSEAFTLTSAAGFALTLTLETGSSDRQATYTGPGAGNTLLFDYVVQAGDTSSDLDTFDENSLDLVNGTIRDALGNDADLTLPVNGSNQNLAHWAAIGIDTTPPSTPTVTLTAATENIRVRWNDVSAVGYLVVRSLDATPTIVPTQGASPPALATTSGDDEVLSTGLALFVLDLSLTAGTPYYYAVYAYDAVYNYSGTFMISGALPSAIPKNPPVTFVQVEVGYRHSCGLTAQGAVYCWGDDTQHQLGAGAGDQSSSTPVAVSLAEMGVGNSTVFKQIAAGYEHTCGLAADGKVHCWGLDDGVMGEGADGSQGAHTKPYPVDMPTDTTFVQIVAGKYHNCALSAKGTVYCWGHDDLGQCAQTATSSTIWRPTAISLGEIGAPSEIRKLYGRYDGACALTVAGDTFCWGRNVSASIGEADVIANPVNDPTEVSQIDSGTPSRNLVFRELAGGVDHGCGVDHYSRLLCWGDNADKELGAVSSNATEADPVGVNVDSTSLPRRPFKKVAAGRNFTCAINLDGRLFCWGANTVGQVGNGTSHATDDVAVPQSFGVNAASDSANHRYLELDAFEDHVCAVTTLGGVHCWGEGSYGQLGNGGTVDASVPQVVSVSGLTGDTGFLQVARGGNDFSCGISTEYRPYCWGKNDYGQLGIGPTTLTSVARPYPLDLSNVSAETRFVKIVTGESHACMLSADARIYCWGNNANGRLGVGATSGFLLRPTEITTTPQLLSAPLYGGHGYRDLTAGGAHTCASYTGGQTSCWGSDADYQIGNDDTVTDETAPREYSNSAVQHVFAEISAGAAHTCGVTYKGTINCWGSHSQGQIGNGTAAGGSVAYASVGAVDGGGELFVSVAAGLLHTCALSKGRELFCWGDGDKGALGIAGDQVEATLIDDQQTNATQFVTLSAGYDSTCGVNSQGTAFCWGYDEAKGRLALGSFVGLGTYTDEPTQAAVGISMHSIAAPGKDHGCGVSSLGKLYCWGKDTSGALGNGPTDTTDKHTPEAVSELAL